MGEFQSGQMGQTVNLLAKPSEVRILPLPLVFLCGSSSSGRATAFQAVGGGFESRFPLHSCFFHNILEDDILKERQNIGFVAFSCSPDMGII